MNASVFLLAVCALLLPAACPSPRREKRQFTEVLGKSASAVGESSAGLSSSLSSAVESVITQTAEGFGSNLNQILNAGVSLMDCLKEIKESGGYSLEELTKFGKFLRILNKLAKYKYLNGFIDTSFDFDFTILQDVIDEASELSPCSQALYQGDMVLSSSQMDRILRAVQDYVGVSDLGIFGETFDFGSFSSVVPAKKKRAVTNKKAERWSMPITYKISTSDLSSIVKKAISEWEEQTCVTFQETSLSLRSLKGNYINFKAGEGCHSNVGKKTKKEGQTISLGSGCEEKYVAAHEIGHALGLWHEQARPDRDDLVTVNKDNIPDKYLGQFLIQSSKDVETYGYPYDHGSVMHYKSTAFTKSKGQLSLEASDNDNQLTMGQRQSLSFYDVRNINKAYCSDACSSQLSCKHDGYTDPKDCSKCRCPEGLTGTTCSQVKTGSSSCGDNELTASASWKTLETSGKKTCYYLIKASSGKVKVKFDSINFECYRSCENYVEIKTGKDFGKTGARFCCKTPSKEYTSESSEAMVIYTGSSAGALKIQYKTA